MNVSLWVAVPVVVLAVLSARADVRTRRIPNKLTLPALALGLVMHLALGGPTGLISSLAGMLIAGGLLLPGWLLRYTGAGDVKLMAAVGAWFAFPLALFVTLATMIAGGLVALAIALRRGILRQTLWNTA